MLPSQIVVVPSLPKTNSGKLDRQALPPPRVTGSTSPAAPRNALQAVVAEAWKEVLEVKEVGILDNFFELGGHSLLAAHLQ